MLRPPSFKMFPQGIPGLVTKRIERFQPGEVSCNGTYWRAQLHELHCPTALLPSQPVLAIGRKNTVLIVIPIHCILWDQIIDDFALSLTPSDLDNIYRYGNAWKNYWGESC